MLKENIQYNKYYNEEIETNLTLHKNNNRLKRRALNKQKLNRLIYMSEYMGYPSAVYWTGKYYKRIHSYGCRRRARIFRKKCNRDVRHYKDKIADGGMYKKCSEFWYMIW